MLLIGQTKFERLLSTNIEIIMAEVPYSRRKTSGNKTREE
jgi:hypothetical protein